MKQITVGDNCFDVHWFTGRVLSASKNTLVSGGAQSGVRTSIHDDVFLEDVNGNERSFQLAGFDLACRPSNQVTIVSMLTTATQTGEYVLVHNHTTKRRVFKERNVKKMTGPNSLAYGFAALGGMAGAFMVFSLGTMFSIMVGNFLSGLAGLAVFGIAVILAPIIFVASIVVSYQKYNKTSTRYRADFDSEWPKVLQASGLS